MGDQRMRIPDSTDKHIQKQLAIFLCQANFEYIESRVEYIDKVANLRACQESTCFCITCIIKDWYDLLIIGDNLENESYFADVVRRLIHGIGKVSHGIYFRSSSDEISFSFVKQVESINYEMLLPSQLLEYANYSYQFERLLLPTRVAIGISKAEWGNGKDQMNNIELLNRSKIIAKYNNEQFNESTASFYSVNDNMTTNIIEKRELEQLIKNKIKNKDFVPYMQPICKSKTSDLIGFECLARTEIRGNVTSPASFLSIIKTYDLTDELDLIICEKTIATIGLIHTSFPHIHLVFNINISGNLIQNSSKRESFIRLLKCANLHSSKKIQVEIVEDFFVVEKEVLEQFFEELRKLDINIYIDDFGFGFSSIERLFTLPIAGVKLDSFFMTAIRSKDRKRRIFLGGVIQQLKEVGFDVIAEGVENEEELAWIQSLNVDKYQGYYYAKPQGIYETINFIKGLKIHPRAIGSEGSKQKKSRHKLNYLIKKIWKTQD